MRAEGSWQAKTVLHAVSDVDFVAFYHDPDRPDGSGANKLGLYQSLARLSERLDDDIERIVAIEDGLDKIRYGNYRVVVQAKWWTTDDEQRWHSPLLRRAFTPHVYPKAQPSCSSPRRTPDDSMLRLFLRAWSPAVLNHGTVNPSDVEDVDFFRRRRRRAKTQLKAILERAVRSLGITGEAARDLKGYALTQLKNLLVPGPLLGTGARPPLSRLVMQFRTPLVGTLTRNAPPLAA